MLEGAFWGDLFANPPALYACYSASNAAHSRLLKRDCAAGHLDENGIPEDCDIIHIVGTCDSACQTMNAPGTFYPSCTPDGGKTWTDKVVTIFLP